MQVALCMIPASNIAPGIKFLMIKIVGFVNNQFPVSQGFGLYYPPFFKKRTPGLELEFDRQWHLQDVDSWRLGEYQRDYCESMIFAECQSCSLMFP